MKTQIATGKQEVEACFPLIALLRPHLSKSEFLSTFERLADSTGYQLAYLEDETIKAVAGMRISEWLHTGKYLEIEELVTSENERSKGYGSNLFDWVCDYAKEQGCAQVRLVSGVKREKAHMFYLRKGMQFEAKYFSINL